MNNRFIWILNAPDDLLQQQKSNWDKFSRDHTVGIFHYLNIRGVPAGQIPAVVYTEMQRIETINVGFENFAVLSHSLSTAIAVAQNLTDMGAKLFYLPDPNKPLIYFPADAIRLAKLIDDFMIVSERDLTFLSTHAHNTDLQSVAIHLGSLETTLLAHQDEDHEIIDFAEEIHRAILLLKIVQYRQSIVAH